MQAPDNTPTARLSVMQAGLSISDWALTPALGWLWLSVTLGSETQGALRLGSHWALGCQWALTGLWALTGPETGLSESLGSGL